eukprot:g1495.t1
MNIGKGRNRAFLEKFKGKSTIMTKPVDYTYRAEKEEVRSRSPTSKYKSPAIDGLSEQNMFRNSNGVVDKEPQSDSDFDHQGNLRSYALHCENVDNNCEQVDEEDNFEGGETFIEVPPPPPAALDEVEQESVQNTSRRPRKPSKREQLRLQQANKHRGLSVGKPATVKESNNGNGKRKKSRPSIKDLNREKNAVDPLLFHSRNKNGTAGGTSNQAPSPSRAVAIAASRSSPRRYSRSGHSHIRSGIKKSQLQQPQQRPGSHSLVSAGLDVIRSNSNLNGISSKDKYNSRYLENNENYQRGERVRTSPLANPHHDHRSKSVSPVAVYSAENERYFHVQPPLSPLQSPKQISRSRQQQQQDFNYIQEENLYRERRRSRTLYVNTSKSPKRHRYHRREEEKKYYRKGQNRNQQQDTRSNFLPNRKHEKNKVLLSPTERNEQIAAQSRKKIDALAYSKKRRHVKYTPKTLADYRQLKRATAPKTNDPYHVLGKLQPDLNTPELLQKRATKKRTETFSRRLRQFNREQEEIKRKNRPQPRAKTPEPPVKTKFQAAMEYFEKLPKPKVKPKKKQSRVSPRAVGVKKLTRREVLEQRHDQLKADVENIRKMFGSDVRRRKR